MLFLVAVPLMFVVSCSGLLVNVYLLVKFVQKLHDSSEFTKLCMAKTVPNILVCAAFLFWSVPLSTFQVLVSEIPLSVGALIGQLIGYGAYVAGPLIQILMAANRSFTIYFPMVKRQFHSNLLTIISLSIVVLIASAFTIRGLFPLSCGFFYNPELLLWMGHDTECSSRMEDAIAVTVICLSVTSNSLNFITLVKLCCEKVGGLSTDDQNKRRRRRIRLFVQSATQDCLHVIDIINWRYIAYISDAVWFEFTFVTMSLLLIHAMDGFVMFYFHADVHPKILRRSKSGPSTLSSGMN